MPKLLGFTECQVFLGAKQINTLYTMSVTEDETADREPVFFDINMKYIEHDYIIPETQVVSFPNNLGLAGYVY